MKFLFLFQFKKNYKKKVYKILYILILLYFTYNIISNGNINKKKFYKN